MAKNYTCPKCGGGLVFDPETQGLHCVFCNESFTVEEVSESKLSLEELIRRMNEPAKPAETGEPEESNDDEFLTMSMKILRCSSCGAELAFRDVETSSFCAYCGQPTIVTERLKDCRRPDFIIPFKVTRERAERLMRTQIESGRFIPDEIRNFEPERVCGIYIPYWLFDVYTSDAQRWKYTDGENVYHYYLAADSTFRRMTMDASRRFNDSFSNKLEPYRTNEAVKFTETYLSGFYSDQADVGKREAGTQACIRAKRMFQEEFTARRKAMRAKEVSSHPVAEEIRGRYALLPVWFMTTRYRDQPYTVLVNGQTGKTVCSLPVNKTKAYGIFVTLGIVLCALLMGLFAIINTNAFNDEMSTGDEVLMFALIYIPITVVFLGLYWLPAIKKLFRIGRGVRDAADGNEQLVNERQRR
ncbi:MAG: hypothetical protein J5938_04080 [Clostridia bacterium]|nr:hypothetical protein [Clostridia bacterium]